MAETRTDDHRLHKCERLTRKRDFEAVYAARRSAADDRLIVYVRPNDLAWSRLGRSVAKKWGKAHERNRFRRRCSEAFRLHRHELPSGHDLIVIPRNGIDLTLDAIAESLVALAAKAAARAPDPKPDCRHRTPRH